MARRRPMPRLGGGLARLGGRARQFGGGLRLGCHQRGGATPTALRAGGGNLGRRTQSLRQVTGAQRVFFVADAHFGGDPRALEEIVTELQVEPKGAPFAVCEAASEE